MPINVLGSSNANDLLNITGTPLPEVASGVLISFWVKTQRANLTGNRTFFTSNSNTYRMYATAVSGTNRQLRGDRSGGFWGYGNVHSDFADGVNEWRNIVGVWTSAGCVAIYANGNKKSRAFFSGTAITVSPATWRLFSVGGSTGGVQGLYADFNIWTGAVDPDDLAGDPTKIAAQAAMVSQLASGADPDSVTLPSGFAKHDRYRFLDNLDSESGLYTGEITTVTSADAIELIADADIPPVEGYLPATVRTRGRNRLRLR